MGTTELHRLCTGWFETNVLLLPTFIAERVNLRITRKKKRPDGEITEKQVCLFNLEENQNMVCFRRRDFESKFHVDGGEDRKEYDVAVVLAMCILSFESHGENNNQEIAS
jgi:hypothetical protein